MADGPRVVVIVLNWNNAADTLTCLESLREHEPAVEIVVIDNGSDDGSADRIAAAGLASVLLRAPTNLGFTGGNNLGLQHALNGDADVLVVLNNDTVLTGPVFSTLAAVHTVGGAQVAVSPLIVRADDPEHAVWFGGGIVDGGLPRHLQPDELPDGDRPRPSEVLTGCCIVAHRSVWQRVGLFDDGFFLFFEDSDWSLRARARGVTLLVDPRSTLHHRVSSSFRGPASMLGTYYYARNGVAFHLRYHHRLTLRFLRDQVVLPPVRGWLRRGPALPAWPYGWFGAVCGLVGVSGPAPRWLVLLAGGSVRRAARRAQRRSSARTV